MLNASPPQKKKKMPKIQNFSLRDKSLVPAEYLSLLSVQVQFGVIRRISSF